MKVKDARRFWGVVSAALLISCHMMSPAGAGVLPVLVESMPTSGKVDLTCAAMVSAQVRSRWAMRSGLNKG